MGEVAIKAQGLGKCYRLGLHQIGNLRETISAAAKHPLQALRRRRERSAGDLLWAVRDFDLEVPEGQVVGLVGHNGAGKSTLLKIFSRITEPTTGWAEIRGRVGSLLEVGTGFHPELTGRENVFLNGAILGMRRAEIRSRFDEIVEFAEVERFLDTPVKRYSSGMQVRLAFAVAAHLEPEIMLVDEVLAVGDSAFQRRSLAKMTEVAKEGRTVIFVSHNLAIIRALCDRGVLLEKGRTLADGPIGDVLDRYLEGFEKSGSQDLLARTDRDSYGREMSLIKRVWVEDLKTGQTDVVVGGHPARFVIQFTEPLPDMHGWVGIFNSLGNPVVGFDSQIIGPQDERVEGMGDVVECEVDSLPLAAGRYRIDACIHGKGLFQDGLMGAAFFDVEPGVIDERPAQPDTEGDVLLPHRWRLPA